MSKWQDKSNEEINIAVTGHRFNCSEWGMNQSKSTFFYDDKGAGVGGKIIVLDYCGEWSYAGPVILGNEISLLKTDDEKWTATLWSNDDIESWNENPLRAAMIVYLEMNGVQPNE